MAAQPGQDKSFNDRLKVEAGRTIIGGYNKSRLGQVFGTYTRPRPSFDRPATGRDPSPTNSPASRQAMNATPQVPPRTFTEPTGRGYNPYG